MGYLSLVLLQILLHLCVHTYCIALLGVATHRLANMDNFGWAREGNSSKLVKTTACIFYTAKYLYPRLL